MSTSLAPIVRRGVDAALEVAVVPSFSRIGSIVRSRVEGWEPAPPGTLDGEVVVITGATSGLGRATAEAVGALGASIELVGRNAERGSAAVAELSAVGVEARFRPTDVGDVAAVSDLADALVASHRRIHAVVHSAGGITKERQTTPQGLETTWASMVVGPRLLTRRLATDLADGLGRAVWVTSGGMYLQDVDMDDLGWEDRDWDGTRAYAQAKRAQVDIVAEASARGEAPLQVAVHPGWANTPGVTDALPGFDRVMGPILRTPDEGADSLVWLVAQPAESLAPGALYHDRRVRGTVRWPGTATSTVDRARLLRIVDDQADVRP
ncbi:SDR family NAD(P)-dependent oxidoreductase [Iamia majanohamensis]|uniref:SDR family NAD(P)-dependent oxidoreductase n=1 Tax=Iamia majanohamensis TaxID=467976 RepID=A0AAE9Y6U0_9ACTN|nr:SDR family NAD(P)-dependent oxidoreductase [Iamia majanohamensis]WCO65413.1 SDR family NAD(P)-dependent oxidoreductase [Iamia majanohamensis]